jgi:hypothetical protein
MLVAFLVKPLAVHGNAISRFAQMARGSVPGVKGSVPRRFTVYRFPYAGFRMPVTVNSQRFTGIRLPETGQGYTVYG